MKEITFVTGNWAKIATAKKILEPLGIVVNHVKMDTTEIQCDDVNDIAKASAKEASEKLKCTVLKNDTGLFVESLNGFPGPYTHYVDETIGEDGLLKLMEGIDNRRAYFKEAYAICEYGRDPIVFNSYTYGTILKKKEGTFGWSWDFIFQVDGTKHAMACYPDDERLLLFSHEGYEKIAEYLNR